MQLIMKKTMHRSMGASSSLYQIPQRLLRLLLRNQRFLEVEVQADVAEVEVDGKLRIQELKNGFKVEVGDRKIKAVLVATGDSIDFSSVQRSDCRDGHNTLHSFINSLTCDVHGRLI
jgi:hypothetical protein